MDCQQQSRQNVHTLDVLFQMPPLSSFCVNIHALSYAVIFGILTSISYQSSQDSHHNLRLTHGGTIQQWGPEYVCLSHSFLSQFPLIDPQTSPNRRLQKTWSLSSHLSTFLLLHMMMLSRDTLSVLVSTLYCPLHIYPVTPTPSEVPSHED